MLKIDTVKNINNNNNNTSLVVKKDGEVAIFGSLKNVSLNMSEQFQHIPHEVIKVMNIVGEEVRTMPEKEYEEMRADVKHEFSKYGELKSLYIVNRNKYKKIGAELGAIFVEFDEVKYAELAYHAMSEKKYSKKI